MYPKQYRYTRDHEWINPEDGSVGLTAHATEELGDIVFVELPAVGDNVSQGDSFGTVESVKAVADCYAPVSGEVIEINEALNDSPEQVNEDPHGEGWMIKLRMADEGELEGAMDAEAYEAFLGEEKQA